MKKLIIFAAIVSFFSCNQTQKHANTVYNTYDWMAIVPTNVASWDGSAGWVKMCVYKDSLEDKWKLNSDGDTIHLKKITSDTFYLLRTADKALPAVDSAGNPRIDPATRQPLYYSSYSHPLAVPKDVVYPLYPIPLRFLQALYASIPSPKQQPDKDTHMINGKIQPDSVQAQKNPIKSPHPVK